MEGYLDRRGRGESCKLLRRAQREPALSLLKVLVGGWATSVQVAALGQYRTGEPASSWPSAGSGQPIWRAQRRRWKGCRSRRSRSNSSVLGTQPRGRREFLGTRLRPRLVARDKGDGRTYIGSFIRPTTSERAASSSHDSGDVRNLPPDYLSSELILIHGVFAGPLAATILSVIHAVSGVFLHSSTIQGAASNHLWIPDVPGGRCHVECQVRQLTKACPHAPLGGLPALNGLSRYVVRSTDAAQLWWSGAMIGDEEMVEVKQGFRSLLLYQK